MKAAVILTLSAITIFAGNKLATHREELANSIAKADKELADAKKARDQKVTKAIKSYMKVLKKAQVYWVKQGDLDRALEVRAEYRKYKDLVTPKKITLPNPQPTAKIDSGVVSFVQPPPDSYRNIKFIDADKVPEVLRYRVRAKIKDWPRTEVKKMYVAWQVWRRWKDKR